MYNRGTCTPIFIAALSKIANYGISVHVQKLQMDKIYAEYIHNKVLLSSKKNEIMSLDKMDGARDYYVE
jgi:hypothetical protein